MTLRKLALLASLAASSVSNGVMAAYLDFTDINTITGLTAYSDSDSNGFTGTVDGVGFTLTVLNSEGVVNFNEGYDGSLNTGCQSNGGPLKCDRDGTGVSNDEITGLAASSGQTLRLVFDSEVAISRFDFLDLYLKPDGQSGEQATIHAAGGPYTVDAVESSGQGGYAFLDFLSIGGPIIGTTILFTANSDSQFWDDHNNDYAFAGMKVSAVPVPAAVWLFGSAMIGLLGFQRRRRTA
jgi:hypothetical protein